MTDALWERTVGELVAEKLARARVFQELGIDFCCGGDTRLDEACAARGIDLAEVILKLQALDTAEKIIEPAEMSLSALADHIESCHHAYVRNEIPRLINLSKKAAEAHGDRDPGLREIPRLLEAFREHVLLHLAKEERILFPMIRALDAGDVPAPLHCGSIADPIRVMEAEHDEAGDILKELHHLTHGFTPPDWACATLRALFDGLRALEADMHVHIHKENNILFPKALALEQQRCADSKRG
jgi:regulator of cell morphogenesis and NO signaling